jgi:type I restriction enzyme R subunit
MRPTARASTASTWKPATKPKCCSYPTPDELWAKTFAEQNAWRDRFAAIPFEDRGGYFQGRYYQDIAIERVLEAIAAGKDRILLTLATGTGKTFVAFQIAWKLFQSRWNLRLEIRQRADSPTANPVPLRSQHSGQSGVQRLLRIPEDAMVRIEPDEIKKKGRVPKNGSLFFTIFQTFMCGPPKDGEPSPWFGDYPPDFFDFIVIDECHRGGANDESTWRADPRILLPGRATGTDRHTETQGQCGHLRLLRRAGVHLFAEGRHQRRIPHAVSSEADSDHAG